MHTLASFFKNVFSWIRRMAIAIGRTMRRYAQRRDARIAFGIIIVFLVFAIIRGALGGGDAVDPAVAERQVRVALAGESTRASAPLTATGEVRSEVQGDLRAQRAGIVTTVNRDVGERVPAGTIIATIENASERARVAQARAGVAQAQASLDKVAGGTREEQLAVLRATTANAERALTEAMVGVRNTLRSAYTTTNTTFPGGVDALFIDADSANPQLRFTTTNGTDANAAEHGRFVLQATIERHARGVSLTLDTAPALRDELNAVEDEFVAFNALLDDLVTAADGAVVESTVTRATITQYQTSAQSARSQVLATLTSLSSARAALNNAENAVVVAQENETQGITGAQEEDIALAQAQLDAAQATLAQSIASLEDTRIRAPVTGVLTRLTVAPGDFVSSFQDVGLVANDAALAVEVFLAPAIAARVETGASVLVDGRYEAVVTSIAPGLDPVRRQIEVQVALIDEAALLPHGSRTTVTFTQTTADTAGSSDEGEADAARALRIPITALKFIGNDSFVFTVSEEGALVALPVVLGDIVLGTVTIQEGITTQTRIVLDARGLSEGDSVSPVE